MQVAHVQDHVTHAVIGANSARSFGISDDPAFFNILSNTLYSDKILAVTREVLCNAWDAHIAAGRTDTPVQVTLGKDALVIRDFGLGIPKDKMHPIYCIYGASTKTNDGEQTGGFGLGCKAPFAYVDHFEVTSFHAGQRTIYRISKSSGEVGGRPGLMEIVSVPSTETGIQVRIEMKSESDAARFRQLIKRIALVGEMNVQLDGDILETLPFSEAKQGFLITRQPITDIYHKIFVRYGNVAYPIENHEAYRGAYNTAQSLLEKLHGNNYGPGWRLILQAKPHSISVTPSRESLSMTDHTIASLKQLLEDFLYLSTRQMELETLRINEECVQRTFMEVQTPELLNSAKTVVRLRANSINEDHALIDINQVSRAAAVKAYPSWSTFRRRDVEMRLRALIESGFGDRGKIQSFLAAYKDSLRGMNPRADWFHRRLVGPLITAMKLDGRLNIPRLMVYGSNEADGPRQRRYSWAQDDFFEATKFSKEEIDSYLPFLRNIVVLSHNRIDVTERLPKFPEMKHWFGKASDILVYIVQRSDPKVEAAREFFTKRGFRIIDLTKRHTWEPAPIKDARPKETESKPRKKGLPVLSCILKTGAEYVSTEKLWNDDAERIEVPEFVVKISARNDNNQFSPFDYNTSRDVVRLFGAKGGIVINDAQHKKYVDQGAQRLVDWIFLVVMNELKTNTRIHQFYTVLQSRVAPGLTYDRQRILKVITDDDVLSTYFDIGHQMTEDDFSYFRIWQQLETACRWTHEKSIKEILDLFKAFPVKPELKKLANDIEASKLVGALNAGEIEKAMHKIKNSITQMATKTKIRDILIFAVKG